MDSLRVYVNDRPVGRLSRQGRGASFVYDHGVDPADAVSLTMPVRPSSYGADYGMLPAFDTSIPEGALRLRIEKALAKDDTGRIDAFDVLAMTGGNQIGRVRLLPDGEPVERREPLGSIDALLRSKSNSALLQGVVDRYALRSGVSGAMPKVLAPEEDPGCRETIQTRDWILKFDDDDYPGLSLNEFHCLEAARRAGNTVVEAELSQDGTFLAVRRFDEGEDGTRPGFEDFASLNAKTSKEKYEGSVETSLMKRMTAISGGEAHANLEALFRQVITSIALRNGDAHLKNFAVTFDDAQGDARITPLYDVVTTRAWEAMAEDTMALTVGGTKRWPKPKAITQLGARARLTPKRTREIVGEVAAGIRDSLHEMVLDISARGHPDLAHRMAKEWAEGIEMSLGAEPVDPEAILPDAADIAARRAELSIPVVEDPFADPKSDPVADVAPS